MEDLLFRPVKIQMISEECLKSQAFTKSANPEQIRFCITQTKQALFYRIPSLSEHIIWAFSISAAGD